MHKEVNCTMACKTKKGGMGCKKGGKGFGAFLKKKGKKA